MNSRIITFMLAICMEEKTILCFFRHIQEHLNNEAEFPKDGQFAEDIQAIENGDDTKGLSNSLDL
jgi:hypothetical protein